MMKIQINKMQRLLSDGVLPGICLILTIFFSSNIMAQASPQDIPQDTPLDLIRNTTAEVFSLLEANQDEYEKNPYAACQVIDKLVISHFDFPRMSRWVLGKYWRRADDKQRQQFETEFRALLVRTYTTALLEYTGRPIEYLPFKDSTGAKKSIVRTAVELRGGLNVAINYRLHLKDGEWKVYDLLIDGISIVTNYKQNFVNDISMGGIDHLIWRLKSRNEELEKQ